MNKQTGSWELDSDKNTSLLYGTDRVEGPYLHFMCTKK